MIGLIVFFGRQGRVNGQRGGDFPGFEQLMPELAKEAGASEALKASDPMQWVGLMNHIKAQAEEIVLSELIFKEATALLYQLYPPRYYQRIAYRTLDAIARRQDRLLLVMATGTGKTYTAFQIVDRLLQSGMKCKILYLTDRNILVDQSIQQDFAPLEKVIHKIYTSKDDLSEIISHQVDFSLYQQLVGDEGKMLTGMAGTSKPKMYELVRAGNLRTINPGNSSLTGSEKEIPMARKRA